MLSVVIPCFNDQSGLEATIDRLQSSLREAGIEFELIVVDDGSSPPVSVSTAESTCRLLQHQCNKGYGAALKTGIRQATGEDILIIDSDGTYPAEIAAELYREYREKQVDVLIGARTGREARVPLVRRPAKWLLNRLASLLTGERIPDLNSGMRVFRRSLFLRYENLFPQGFSFTSTLTLACMTDGFAVTFEPIEYRGRIGHSKIRPIRDTYNFFLLLITMIVYFNPLRVLIPASIGLFVLSVAVLLFTRYVLGRLADVTVTVLFMLSFQTAVLGLVADVIVKRSRTPAAEIAKSTEDQAAHER